MKKIFILFFSFFIGCSALKSQTRDSITTQERIRAKEAKELADSLFKLRGDREYYRGSIGKGASVRGLQKDLVRAVFNGYRAAILNDNGADAADCVDSLTINYYAEMLDHVKNGDSIAVNQLTLMDKFMVLAIRHRTPKDFIDRFDGRKMFIYAVEEGMVAKSSVEEHEMGDIIITKKSAMGVFIMRGKPRPLSFQFYKENGAWKLNLTNMFPMAEYAFKQLIEDSEMEENEYLLFLLELVTGDTVSESIWMPSKELNEK